MANAVVGTIAGTGISSYHVTYADETLLIDATDGKTSYKVISLVDHEKCLSRKTMMLNMSDAEWIEHVRKVFMREAGTKHAHVGRENGKVCLMFTGSQPNEELGSFMFEKSQTPVDIVQWLALVVEQIDALIAKAAEKDKTIESLQEQLEEAQGKIKVQSMKIDRLKPLARAHASAKSNLGGAAASITQKDLDAPAEPFTADEQKTIKDMSAWVSENKHKLQQLIESEPRHAKKARTAR